VTVLACAGLTRAFGGVQAVSRVGLTIERGELVGLIGPNGAGKTTLLRLLAGMLAPDAGTVTYDGLDVTRMPLHRRAQLGRVLTHQIVRPFRRMTLAENVMIAAGAHTTRGPWRALVSVDNAAARDRARALLACFGIADAADKPVTAVPLGYLKRMQLARALALDPQVLMLDEPLAGLNAVEATRLADQISALRAGGLTVVLVEHNLGEITRISSRLAVLHNGSLLASGPPNEVMARADVRDAYLGAGRSRTAHHA